LGTGIITTALKSGIAPAQTVKRAVDQMKSLNRKTAEILNDFEVHACTDITGYGLAGHLSEVSRGSGMDCKIRISDVPFLEGAKELVLAGSVPGGTRANLEYYSNWISWDPLIPEPLRLLFCDAQTSGGLLFALQQNDAASALALLRDAGMKEASVIGSFTGAGEGRITVTG
jgi:selenide,water dikinase